MVLMGINLLVVADGNINAKVLFQLDTEDTITKDATQTASFQDGYKYSQSDTGWFSPDVSQDYTSSFSVATTKPRARRPKSTCTPSCQAR
jgi:hypothetical protein